MFFQFRIMQSGKKVIKTVGLFKGMAKTGTYRFSFFPVDLFQWRLCRGAVVRYLSICFLWPASHGLDIHAVGFVGPGGMLRVTQPGQLDHGMSDRQQMSRPSLTVAGV